MNDRPTVLLFNVANAKKRSIRTILTELKIKGRDVLPQDQGKSIGDLLGDSRDALPASAKAETFRDEMLVLHALSEKQMDRLLRELRSRGATVAIKAVTTPVNIAWSGTDLFEALKREHEAIQKLRAIQKTD